jgi:MFS family permease
MATEPLPHLTSYRQLLGATEVRALLAAALLSRLAGRMFALTIVLYGVAQANSTVLAGWLAFAAVAPGLVISPIAGSLIDRLGSAWAIAIDMTGSAVFMAALAAAAGVGSTDAVTLLVLTGCFSLTSPLSFAGIRALLPRLVSPVALDRANALDTAINGLTDVAGPALAGLIFGLAGPFPALATIAAIYAAAVLCIAQIGWGQGSLPRLAPLLTEAWRGLLRVINEPTLRGLALSYSLYEVCWGVLIVTVPVFAAQPLPRGCGCNGRRSALGWPRPGRWSDRSGCGPPADKAPRTPLHWFRHVGDRFGRVADSSRVRLIRTGCRTHVDWRRCRADRCRRAELATAAH